jgi:hypothetical protein
MAEKTSKVLATLKQETERRDANLAQMGRRLIVQSISCLLGGHWRRRVPSVLWKHFSANLRQRGVNIRPRLEKTDSVTVR